jgi:hypothetical protein
MVRILGASACGEPFVSEDERREWVEAGCPWIQWIQWMPNFDDLKFEQTVRQRCRRIRKLRSSVGGLMHGFPLTMTMNRRLEASFVQLFLV